MTKKYFTESIKAKINMKIKLGIPGTENLFGVRFRPNKYSNIK